MKKLLIIVMAVLFCATDVSAAPFHHRGHHRRPEIVIRHAHRHHVKPLAVAAAGIIGYAIAMRYPPTVRQAAITMWFMKIRKSALWLFQGQRGILTAAV